MLNALLLLVLGVQHRAGPAFLDSFQTIHVPLDRPLTPQEIKRPAVVTVGGRTWPVRSVSPCGDPVKERRLPRAAGRVVLPGTIQSALGGKDWEPDGEETQMKEVASGVYELVVELPAGSYEFKIARNGSWDENYGVGFVAGGGNFHLAVPVKQAVKFVVDLNAKTLADSIDDPSRIQAPASAEQPRADQTKLKYQVAEVILALPLDDAAVESDVEVKLGDDDKKRVFARDVLDSPDFTYSGPLGADWSPGSTTFRVWSPGSHSGKLLLFGSLTGAQTRRVPMSKARNGLWTATVPGDLSGAYYQYEFESYGETRVTADISCRSAGYGSSRSQVVDLKSTNPKVWVKKPPIATTNPVDAVVYEVSVRDLTVSPTSGVDPSKRGKYAGLGQTGTTAPVSGVLTGLDYMKRLGVTHVQILPVQDFLVSSSREYSWGYATCLFNVPEESYGVNPSDRIGVIREFKQMVSQVHRAGLGVVMDVVYNHTWPPEGKDSAFWQTVPYYYFRTDLAGRIQNESGVGNAFDDDRPMARKYVLDSLLYWQKEYGIDGFRFDLLGMFRKSSVAAWAAALHRQDPNCLVYGEPWTGGGPTRFGKGVQRGLGVGVFNDDFRTVFRGDVDGSNTGFAAGGGADKDALIRAVTGSTASGGFAAFPSESINYVSAHDNLTLWDRLGKSVSGDEALLRAMRLSFAAVLLSQGVPFLEGGPELGRTKGGNRNSYNAGDAVNQFDWERGAAFQDLSAYLAGLIALRRAEPGLRLRTADEIRRRIRFINVEKDSIVFSIDELGLGGAHSNLIVVLNGANAPLPVTLPPGAWKVLIPGIQTSAAPGRMAARSWSVLPMTACVWAR
jgi:pullulanase